MHNVKTLGGIDTVIIRVSDVQTAKTWYQEKLQLSAIWDDPIAKLTVLDTGGPTSLTIWQTGEPIKPNKDTASFPIFRTMDAEAARTELKARGVEVSELITDHAVTYFVFYDPDGNVLEACQVHE